MRAATAPAVLMRPKLQQRSLSKLRALAAASRTRAFVCPQGALQFCRQTLVGRPHARRTASPAPCSAPRGAERSETNTRFRFVASIIANCTDMAMKRRGGRAQASIRFRSRSRCGGIRALTRPDARSQTCLHAASWSRIWPWRDPAKFAFARGFPQYFATLRKRSVSILIIG
jgi:hypothetical protein